MARTIQDAKFDTRAARLRLKVRREPYWRTISEGMGIGYRKGAKGGTWIARVYDAEHGRRFQSIGTSDDIVDADGVKVFSFSQAQEAARNWFQNLAKEDGGEITRGSYSVNDAMADYLAEYTRRSGKGLYIVKTTINAHITPTLGPIQVAKLTREKIEKWLDEIASKPPRRRTPKGEKQGYRPPATDQDATRRRRSTANRILTLLKAALNLAYDHGRVLNKKAWDMVKPYKSVSFAKIRYLTDQESVRLVNACPDDLRQIVTAALMTGARYGELIALNVGDFDPINGLIQITQSKSGKPRYIVLTDEGRDFFKQVVVGKQPNDRVFIKSNGANWRSADQTRRMPEACANAQISPAIGFHILRHTYASRLAMKGVPLTVIAAQLGHSDTRMTEKHYAHLASSYITDTVRASFGTLGIIKTSNVTSIEEGHKK